MSIKNHEDYRKAWPQNYELFDRFKVYPVDAGFGWIIEGQAGTKSLADVFDYLAKKTRPGTMLEAIKLENPNQIEMPV